MRLLHLLLIPISISLLACSQDAPEEVREAIRPVKIFQVRSSDALMLRKFPAQVHSAEQAELAFRVAGELQRLPATAGQDVRRGDVLAVLDPRDYQILVDDRKARQQLAQSQFQRTNDLFKRQQVSKAQLDQATAELDISNAALAAARSDLSLSLIHI